MEEEKKKTTFLFVFLTYPLCFYSNFDRDSSLDVELNSTSNEYPLSILLTDPATPKIRNTWKNVMMLCFYSIFDQESSLDVELNSAYNKYPLGILLMDLSTPKTRNTWKQVMMMSSSHFFQVFLVFWVAGPMESMPSGCLLDVEF